MNLRWSLSIIDAFRMMAWYQTFTLTIYTFYSPRTLNPFALVLTNSIIVAFFIFHTIIIAFTLWYTRSISAIKAISAFNIGTEIDRHIRHALIILADSSLLTGAGTIKSHPHGGHP